VCGRTCKAPAGLAGHVKACRKLQKNTDEGTFAHFDDEALRNMYLKDNGKSPPPKADRQWLLMYHKKSYHTSTALEQPLWSTKQIATLKRLVLANMHNVPNVDSATSNMPFWTDVAKKIGGNHTHRSVTQYWYKQVANKQHNKRKVRSSSSSSSSASSSNQASNQVTKRAKNSHKTTKAKNKYWSVLTENLENIRFIILI
jgi:hypothetical protein